MRVGHFVCHDGVSGDMLLGALHDAGVPADIPRAAVAALPLEGVDLIPAPSRVGGTVATRFAVEIDARVRRVERLADAVALLEQADLEPSLAELARRTFERLASAEARAHGTDVGSVRFHELGNPDTIVDIVGVCASIEALSFERLTCGPVALGAGRTQTGHGTVTVPPPAVVHLLTGFVVEGGGRQRELATPTGAALLATLTEPVAAVPRMRLTATGRGASSDATSAVTMLVGETEESHAGRGTVVLETAVDDMSPEFVPAVLDRLREEGAQDAWAVPVVMKKGRPGLELKAIVDASRVDHLTSVLFRDTSTLGVRAYEVTKQELPRYWVNVEVEGQPVRVKAAELDGRPVNVAPEFDDVRLAAQKLARSLDDVRHVAVEKARRRIAEKGARWSLGFGKSPGRSV